MATLTPPPPARAALRRQLNARLLLGLAVAALVVLGGGLGLMRLRMAVIPADLDLAATRLSDQGLYRVAYTAEPTTIPLNQLHSWTLRVTTPDGGPVTDAVITIDGDMPQHGHGLPTQPQVTQNLDDGRYLVEGMKFQMGGWWVVDVSIDAAGRRDTARFNLILE